MHDQGRDDEAIVIYRNLIDKNVADAFIDLGRLYQDQGNLEQAYAIYEDAVAALPEDLDFRLKAAATAIDLERPDDSLRHVRLVARHPAATAADLFRVAAICRLLGRDDYAAEAFAAGIPMSPDRLPPAFFQLGDELIAGGKQEPALDHYRTALDALSGNRKAVAAKIRIRLRMLKIYCLRGEWPMVLRHTEKILRLDPKHVQAIYYSALAHYEQGQTEAAEVAFRRALELDAAAVPDAYLKLAKIADGRREPGEVLCWLDQGMPRPAAGTRSEALLLAAKAHCARGELRWAESAYGAVLSEDGEQRTALLALGQLLAAEGDFDLARRHLQRARELIPADTGVLLDLAAVEQATGNWQAEKALYETLLGMHGGSPAGKAALRVNLARILLAQGDGAGAKQVLAPLVDSLPDRRRLQTVSRFLELGAAVVRVLDGDVGGGAAMLEQALAANPEAAGEPAVRAALGQALWLAGRRTAARGHLEAAVKADSRLFSRTTAVGLRLALGEIALHERSFSRASRWLRSAEQLCRTQPRGGGEGPWSDLGAGDPELLCRRVSQGLDRTLVGEALATVTAPGDDGKAIDLAQRALERRLDGELRAVALLTRGVARMGEGDRTSARADLTASLAGLPKALHAVARHNLEVMEKSAKSHREVEHRPPSDSPELLVHLPGTALEAKGTRLADAARMLAEYLSQRVPGLLLQIRSFHYPARAADVLNQDDRHDVVLTLTEDGFLSNLGACAMVPACRLMRSGKTTYKRLVVVRADRRELQDLSDLHQGSLAVARPTAAGWSDFLRHSVFEDEIDPESFFDKIIVDEVADDADAIGYVNLGSADAALVADFNPRWLRESEAGNLRSIFTGGELDLPVLAVRESGFPRRGGLPPAQRSLLQQALLAMERDPQGRAVLAKLGFDGIRAISSPPAASTEMVRPRARDLPIPGSPPRPGDLSFPVVPELPAMELPRQRLPCVAGSTAAGGG
ncbi:MAG: PhnD/SsuA/transferrin family substrate-binding protein [bacterium]|nr:PhnD/SsuA/transferrin family substrate-binding protein [bacterium]